MIQVVGLGPGSLTYLLPEARHILEEAELIYTRTHQHPIFEELELQGRLKSFDYLYENKETFQEVYEGIVDKLIELSQKEEIIYAVNGSPFMAETTVELLKQRVDPKDLHFVPGVSFLEPLINALGVDVSEGLSVYDGLTAFSPNPNHHGVILQIYNQRVAGDVKLQLMTTYPDDHPISLIDGAGLKDQKRLDIPLYELDRQKTYGHLLSLYVPPFRKNWSLDRLFDLVQTMIQEDPWAKRRDHKDLKPYLLEEVFEVFEAINQDDDQALEEELGDVLFQILFHSGIAQKRSAFYLNHVLERLMRKLEGRFKTYLQEDPLDLKNQDLSDEELHDLWLKQKEKEGQTGQSLQKIPKVDLVLLTKKMIEVLDQKDSSWQKDLSLETQRWIDFWRQDPQKDLLIREELMKIIKKYP